MAQLTIQPPLAGIVRGRGFQKQPPFSSRDSINFWPQFVFDGSQTLGIRPPLDEYIAVATHPVNLLCRINGTIAETPQRTFVAAVNGQLQRWNGSGLVNVGGTGTIDTGRAVFAAAFEQKVFIPGTTPLVYDYPSDTLSVWTASSGTVPQDARIITYWLGSLWTAGSPNDPHVVSGCKSGDPFNWNFNLNTPGAAFSTIGDNAGLISDPVCALMPTLGDTMIVSGPDSMQAWRGHPRRGGVADILSSSIGVRGHGAWTLGSDGTVFAITNRGLVAIANGEVISLISDDRIPNSLIGLDYDYLDPRVMLAYDARFNGVHITVRGDTLEESEGFYYDLKHGGLHESEFVQYPHVMLRFDPIGTGRASEVLFGGSGGLFRHDMDGTESYRARIVMGPMKLSNNATERSKITEAQIVFGGGTTAMDAKVAFYCGPTGDSAYAAAVSGQAAAKYVTTVDRVMASQGRIRPMVAGHAATMVIDQEDAMTNPKIMFEEANLQLTPAGRERGYVMHSDTSGPRAGSFRGPGLNLANGIFAKYAFEEATGDRVDDGPNGLNLALGGGAESGSDPGKHNDGLLLDSSGGASVFYDSITTASINPDLGMTMALWVKYTGALDTDLSNVTLTFLSAADLQRLTLLTYNGALGGGLSGTLESASDQWSQELFASDYSIVLDDGEFHLLVVYYDPNAQVVGVGLDNNYVTLSSGGSHNGGAGDCSIGVGMNYDSGGDMSPKVFDELYVWNRCLSAAERTGLWNAGAGRFAPAFN